MSYLFTSESVSEGHPDKLCDQISDALLDAFLKEDPESKVACETLATTGLVVCAGEVKTEAYVSIDDVVRDVIKEVGYDKSDYQFDYKSCGVLSVIHSQSPDINQGVERNDIKSQGAGDQGIMFGYACNEMDNFMPLPIELAHRFVQELAYIRKETDLMPYLRPDSKSQVTVKYSNDHKPERIDTIVLSTQHDPKVNGKKLTSKMIADDIQKYLIPRVIESCPEKVRALFDSNYKLYVNPTGSFVIGGPHGDTGLTGRKIIVDTYGGRGAHGGGAFSGKDPSKVDRSAAYAARHIAKNMVAAGICDQVLVQLSYAIGRAKPVGIFIDTYGSAKVNKNDGEIAKIIEKTFDLTPYGIIERYKLKNPIYQPTASYGHFGRDPYTKTIKGKKVEFFTWEKLDSIDLLKNAFNK
ncbi:MAG: methionine adenosyltransferase [Bacteroidales bacterium]|nr:methionine adenosyltransferase [Bacteroidales bacterium]